MTTSYTIQQKLQESPDESLYRVLDVKNKSHLLYVFHAADKTVSSIQQVLFRAIPEWYHSLQWISPHLHPVQRWIPFLSKYVKSPEIHKYDIGLIYPDYTMTLEELLGKTGKIGLDKEIEIENKTTTYRKIIQEILQGVECLLRQGVESIDLDPRFIYLTRTPGGIKTTLQTETPSRNIQYARLPTTGFSGERNQDVSSVFSLIRTIDPQFTLRHRGERSFERLMNHYQTEMDTCRLRGLKVAPVRRDYTGRVRDILETLEGITVDDQVTLGEITTMTDWINRLQKPPSQRTTEALVALYQFLHQRYAILESDQAAREIYQEIMKILKVLGTDLYLPVRTLGREPEQVIEQVRLSRPQYLRKRNQKKIRDEDPELANTIIRLDEINFE